MEKRKKCKLCGETINLQSAWIRGLEVCNDCFILIQKDNYSRQKLGIKIPPKSFKFLDRTIEVNMDNIRLHNIYNKVKIKGGKKK